MLCVHIHHTICTHCTSQASIKWCPLSVHHGTCMYNNLMHLPCLCSWERPHWVCNCRQRRDPLLPRYPHYQLQTPSTSHSEYYHSLDPQSSNHLFRHASYMKRLYLSLVWLERRQRIQNIAYVWFPVSSAVSLQSGSSSLWRSAVSVWWGSIFVICLTVITHFLTDQVRKDLLYYIEHIVGATVVHAWRREAKLKSAGRLPIYIIQNQSQDICSC